MSVLNDFIQRITSRLNGKLPEPQPQPSQEPSRNVALVLGGGGARGYAHIGAIEALLEHGYTITSIAGTSMGALVGGVYAAGKMQEMKDMILGLTRRQIVSLIDISPGLDHIATGERLQELLTQMTGNTRIEDLPVSFCCCASDVVSGKEHVFRSGPLTEAVRASISIPCLFSPVHIGNQILVDGSVHNTLPLNVAERHDGDLLVAVNASAPDEQPHLVPTNIKTEKRIRKWMSRRLPLFKTQLSENYLSMASRVAQIAVQTNTQMAMAITPPDVCAEVPMDKFGLLDFHRGKEIIAYGKHIMEEALARMEQQKLA